MARIVVAYGILLAGMLAVPAVAMAAAPSYGGAASIPRLGASPQNPLTDDAARELRSAPLWLDPAADRLVDVAAVTSAIGGAPIKIAILPAGPSVSEVRALPRLLAADLPGNTVAVIAGRYFYAGSEVLCTGEAGRAASTSIDANEEQLDADGNSDLTKTLTDFVTAVEAAPRCEAAAARGDRYADEPGGGEVTGVDDTATVLPWVVAGVGTAALAVGIWVALARRRARSSTASARDEAQAAVDRLARVIADRAPEDSTEAVARHGEASTLLLGATTDQQFRQVRRIADHQEDT